ncbi:hypothetical protein N7486_003046 [Penicillium sp. IBT 16267x]|nr:hypothetical protein N7486_003046 [Penicillium sp. IBT 16267x]
MNCQQIDDPLNPSNKQLFMAPSEAFLKKMAKLQAALKDRLPGHMIPALYLPVSNIPLTVSGKINRKHLREQVSQFSQEQIDAYLGNGASDAKMMPTTSTEKTLQRMWSEILSLPINMISIYDSWTRLSGDSISAMKLVSQARLEGYSFVVADIFRHKTINGLARVVAEMKETQGERGNTGQVQPFKLLGPEASKIIESIAEQCQIEPSLLDDAYPCIDLQSKVIEVVIQRQANLTMRLEFQMPGDLDRCRLIEAWEAAVRSNPLLRTRIVQDPESKSKYLQAVVRERVPLLVLNDSDEYNSDYALGLDIWQLGKPLVRVVLQGDLLVMLIHHTLYDGSSWPLIFHDIERAYWGQVLQPHSYVPFVQWASDTGALTRQFWADKMAGFHGQLFPSLGDDMVVPVNARNLHCQLPIIHDDYTIANKIRLALVITMSWYHKTTDIVLGTLSSRRSAPIPGIATLPGPTAQVFPERVQLHPAGSLESNLERVQNQALATMEFEGINLNEIAALSSEAALSCRFQTILALQGEKDISDDSIFRRWQMPTYWGKHASWNLEMIVSLSTDTARVTLTLSEATRNLNIQWQLFLDQFQSAFDLLQTQPHLPLEEAILIVFHTPQTSM